MRTRPLLALMAILMLGFSVQAAFAARPDAAGRPLAARPHQAANPTATGTPATGTATSTTAPTAAATTTGTPATAVATTTGTPATATTTPTSVATATTTAPAAMTVVPEVLPTTPGVTARFTVIFMSAAPGQGKIYFGTSCNGLVEVGTRDQHAGTTQHAVVVTGNDLPGSVGDNGIQPGTTYYFETVNVTASGEVNDNNGGKCYSVTIPSSATTASVRVLTAMLFGANETAGGAPGSTGGATIVLNLTANTVCWTISAFGVSLPATLAHIHRGAAGVAGPVVVPLSAPGASGTSTGCSAIDPALAQDIAARPSGYYVNVHTTGYPAGAMRGQLG